MNIFSLLAALACGVNLLLGFFVYSHGPRSKAHRLFLLMALFQAVWCLTGVVIFSAPDIETFLFWYLAGAPFYIGYYPLTLHFFLALTEQVRPPRWAPAALYLPTLLIVMGVVSDHTNFQVFERVGSYWTFTFVTGSWQYWVYIIYFFFCFLGVAALLVLWRRGSGRVKVKRQARVMLAALAATLTLGFLEAVLLPELGVYRSRGLAPLIFIVWTSGIAWAIVRYRLLTLSSALVSEEIVSCIDEPVLLLDGRFNVTMANRAAGEMLGVEAKKLIGRLFIDLVLERELAALRLKKIMRGALSRGVARLRFARPGGEAFCDVRFSRVSDRFGDVLGILAIGRAAESLEALKERHRMTGREIEVVQYLLSGMSNAEIGEALGTTERTVKTHLTSVFNKLGVSSRHELSYLLKDYAAPPCFADGEDLPGHRVYDGPRLLVKRH